MHIAPTAQKQRRRDFLFRLVRELIAFNLGSSRVGRWKRMSCVVHDKGREVGFCCSLGYMPTKQNESEMMLFDNHTGMHFTTKGLGRYLKTEAPPIYRTIASSDKSRFTRLMSTIEMLRLVNSRAVNCRMRNPGGTYKSLLRSFCVYIFY